MDDQLALYRLSQEGLERAAGMDFIEGAETASYLERKGQHVDELFLDGGVAAGDILGPLSTITGTPLAALLGRGGEPVGPTGPYTFCTRITPDALQLQLKGLELAQRALGQSSDPEVTQIAGRVQELASSTGLGPALGRELRQIEKFLGKGRGLQGALIAVYTRW
jgi:hypothetical protein